jgi:signal transduction histidine kinase
MAALRSIAALLTRSRPRSDRRHLEGVRRFDAAKDEFVSLVSQELRTPLTSVRGYLDLVLDGSAGELTPDQERFLSVASRSCDRLHRLVDDLLVIAHADSGRLELDWARVDFVELVGEVVDSHRDAAALRRVELVLIRHGRAPLLADAALLRRLVDAIVANSVARAPAGTGVELYANADRMSAQLVVTAPAGELPIPGSGLSLSVARAIAEAHGGGLELQDVGDSTGVTVTVPTHIAERSRLGGEAA